MRIQMKILLLSLLLVIALIVGLGALQFRYNASVYVNNATSDLQILTDKLAIQLEMRIRQMDFALLFMISEPNFLSAVASYASSDRSDAGDKLLLAGSSNIINRILRSYAIDKNFYRTSLFDEHGVFFSSHYRGDIRPPEPVEDILARLPWTDEADGLRGKMLLLRPYRDPWAAADAPLVYGIVRALHLSAQSNCYLEVQNLATDLDALLILPQSAAVQILDAGGGLFYGSASLPHNNLITVSSQPNQYGLSVRTSIDQSALSPLIRTYALQSLALCLGVLLLSIAYLYAFTRRLTRPLRALQASMERTSDLSEARPPRNMDEFESLRDAYTRLLERLDAAMRRQIDLETREMKAKFDALQAQIDPHFLNNVLNVIASRAMQTGDEEILEVCDGIAGMLRYSTSTQERVATVGAELAHLTAYLRLMKRRYQHKLEYTVDVPELLLSRPMPKMVLQPIAENALRHGFQETGGRMCVRVEGAVLDGQFQLWIDDNGAGFSGEALRMLQERMQSASEVLLPEDGFSIGGMGLVNTYARLRTFYGGAFSMRVMNLSPGARVLISVPVHKKEGEYDAHFAGGG